MIGGKPRRAGLEQLAKGISAAEVEQPHIELACLARCGVLFEYALSERLVRALVDTLVVRTNG